MAERQTQNFKNHGRIVPVYHIGVFFILLANFIWTAYRLTQGLHADAVVAFLMSVALILMFFSVRVPLRLFMAASRRSGWYAPPPRRGPESTD